MRFEDLPKPFVCVATEIRTGHEIWLSSGSLITAMRASYALPGVFEPVTCNGRVLVDGALVNPVPVSVCRAYEQPLVVAVNLHYDLFGRAAVIKHNAGELTVEQDATPAVRFNAESRSKESRLGLTGVMVEAFNIIQDRISRARLAGDPPDHVAAAAGSAISACPNSTAPTRRSASATRRPRRRSQRPAAAADRAGLTCQRRVDDAELHRLDCRSSD